MEPSREAIRLACDGTVLVLCAGFEARARRFASLAVAAETRPARTIVLRYPGHDADADVAELAPMVEELAPHDGFDEIVVLNNPVDAARRVAEICAPYERVVCDVSGTSRVAMLNLLTVLHDARKKICVTYTEANEYYPRLDKFKHLLNLADPSEAFLELSAYEREEIMYSAHCNVEVVATLPGQTLPNSPVFLLGFLAFKRSRLGAITSHFETNKRVFVRGAPSRPEWGWRERAVELINFDLISECDATIQSLPTADWRATCAWLNKIYTQDRNQYRYNFLLAPLGSKLQTLGAWRFAIEHREVRVVTATPGSLFKDTYSEGYGGTWLFDHETLMGAV